MDSMGDLFRQGRRLTSTKYFVLVIWLIGQILDQIFEDLEKSGLSVGAISPFNADNRLASSKFFIPDPWTQTRASGGYIIEKLSRTVSRFVNSNASGKVGPVGCNLVATRLYSLCTDQKMA